MNWYYQTTALTIDSSKCMGNSDSFAIIWNTLDTPVCVKLYVLLHPFVSLPDLLLYYYY